MAGPKGLAIFIFRSYKSAVQCDLFCLKKIIQHSFNVPEIFVASQPKPFSLTKLWTNIQKIYQNLPRKRLMY